MGRLQNSWEIAKQSWAVLRANPALAAFPVISFIATVLVSLPFLAPIAFLLFGFSGQERGHEAMNVATAILMFLMYLATYTVVIFFNAALISCAHRNLQGQPATMADGIKEASSRLPQIVGWAVLAATVGQLLRMIQERTGLIGNLIAGALGIAWNLAIFLVVPVLVIEKKGPVDSLKSSVERLRQTWGEQLILNGGLGIIGSLFVFLPTVLIAASAIVPATLGAWPVSVLLLIIAVLYAIAGSCVMSCMSVIHQTALYLYTTNHMVPTGFSPSAIQGAFGPRR